MRVNILSKNIVNEKALMMGNEAMSEAAVRAGCRFYAGYPITPQNEVSEYLAKRMPEAGGSFVQAESELAAVNMVFGAAATGVRAMTSSSSPGISLKQEGISYIAAAQIPCLIVNIMRGGPGLGNIRGSQGDYFQATRGGGHGEGQAGSDDVVAAGRYGVRAGRVLDARAGRWRGAEGGAPRELRRDRRLR